MPLAYAWEGQTQLGKDVYLYKRGQGDAASIAIGNLAALLYAFGLCHAQCPGRKLGQPVTAKAVMPSLRGNPGTALRQMSERLLPDWPRIRVAATGNYGDAGRELDPAHFNVDPSPAFCLPLLPPTCPPSRRIATPAYDWRTCPLTRGACPKRSQHMAERRSRASPPECWHS